jgi:hypothetical protein
MASIYDLNTGHTITVGVQGSSVSTEARNMARRIAKDRNRSVLLEDDNGDWIVGPRGRIRAMTSALARRYGFNQQQEF